jgi:O-methyltransferase/aklanonic acid methyltransferase
VDGEKQKEQIADLYHRVAPIYGHVGPNFFEYAGLHMVEYIGIKHGSQVLDVAAGRGANLFPAAEKAGPHGQVTGIDLAAGMVRETTLEIQRRQLHNAQMIQMDVEDMTFPDKSFDYVVCGFAIFLFPHLELALSEFFRVLRPGGKLGITVAQDLDMFSKWYGEHITGYQRRYGFPLSLGRGKGSNHAQLPQYLISTGFVNVHSLEEQADFDYKDEKEWWDSRWTHGTRYALEHMSPEVLALFKAEVFEKLSQEKQSNGLRESLLVQYILADKAG